MKSYRKQRASDPEIHFPKSLFFSFSSRFSSSMDARFSFSSSLIFFSFNLYISDTGSQLDMSFKQNYIHFQIIILERKLFTFPIFISSRIFIFGFERKMITYCSISNLVFSDIAQLRYFLPFECFRFSLSCERSFHFIQSCLKFEVQFSSYNPD